MEKSSRPVRNRRHNRRVWPPGDTHRPVKRLFTPEIKRMLKDWLVRRRDNPYPSRDEKKALAFETGLTYTQICNWFANWRRKLKNSGKEPTKKTWGHLIKNYNVNAKGNVEQFSICSNDSIWGDEERSTNGSNSPEYSNTGGYSDERHYRENYSPQRKNEYYNNFNCNNPYQECIRSGGHIHDINSSNYKNYIINNNNYYENRNESAIDHYYTSKAQCFQISSTTATATTAGDPNSSETTLMNNNNDEDYFKNQNHVFTSNTKYKQQMMEKYLRDNNVKSSSSSSSSSSPSSASSSSTSSPELSKWLESAANFTPNKNNYYIEWNLNKNKLEKKQSRSQTSDSSNNCANFYLDTVHQKEELDAAEALANLACNYRQKIMNNSENCLPSY